jgi:hypothetical protein
MAEDHTMTTVHPDGGGIDHNTPQTATTGGSATTSAVSDGRFWLAVAVITGFAVLTGLVYVKAATFEQGIQLWDKLAVTFSAIVGGLLGFTVNNTRASRAEDKAHQKEDEAAAAKNEAGKVRRDQAAMQPIVQQVVDLAHRRMADDSLMVHGGAHGIDTPPGSATSAVDGTILAGRTLQVSGADPDLVILASHARNVLRQAD